MPLNPQTLRKVFAGAAVVVVLVVSGFYLRGILRQKVTEAPKPIPTGITQSAREFNFSRSEGGKTLFSIHAASFEQFKEAGRVALHDVSIIVYGRQGTRSDQIYGADFEFDPGTGDVTAKGDVQIDLEAESGAPVRPGQTPRETKNLIHLKTSGFVFNEKTRQAQTTEKIEFRIPEASGSAIGAFYDSKTNALELKSAVRVVSTGEKKATLVGQRATITKDPRRIIVQSARLEQETATLVADRITVYLRDDNSVDKILGSGNIHATRSGERAFVISAPQAEMTMAASSQIRSAVFSGGVAFQGTAGAPAQGKAEKAVLDFGPRNQLAKMHVEGGVDLSQGTPAKSIRLQTPAADIFAKPGGKILDRAVTQGAAQIVIVQAPSKTVITADSFVGKFNAANRLSAVTGNGNTKVVTSRAGQPDGIATGKELVANFTQDQKGIASAEQSGDFHYQEGQRTVTADRGKYIAADEVFEFTGSPRLTDSGAALTANEVQINRKTGTATARGDVKATYNQPKPANASAQASSDPIHVTGDSMTSTRGSARFTNARMWRSSDVIQAPVIIFDQKNRGLQAQSGASGRVVASFVQLDKSGKATPVDVTSDKLSYVEADHKAIFSGNVLTRITGATIASEDIQVLLAPQGNQGNQLDKILASGNIQIQQGERRATGGQLIYTAQDKKFVLRGSSGRLPSIFDAEQGQITGDSLTFFIYDGRVLVESPNSTPNSSQSQTKNRDASKK